MSLAIKGNDLSKFFDANKAILVLVDRKWTTKLTLFAKLTSVFCPYWGSKKVIFGTFSKFFWSCLKIVPHYISSPLGFCEALINLEKASPGVLVLGRLENCFPPPRVRIARTPKVSDQVDVFIVTLHFPPRNPHFL